MDRALLLERLAALVARIERPHPLRVAVDGPSAAGKTILADALVAPFRRLGRPVVRASVDGFHRPRAERYRRGAGSPEGYYHDAFDYAALRTALLLPLGPGGDRRYCLATFDYRDDRPVDESPLTALTDAILLCDGVFLLRPELEGCWDFCIFLDVDDEVAIQRAAQRDQDLFGDADAVRARYWERYVPAQRMYEEWVRPRQQADVVVDNNDPANPCPDGRCRGGKTLLGSYG